MTQYEEFINSGYGREPEGIPLKTVDDMKLRNAIKLDLMNIFKHTGEQDSVEGLQKVASVVIKFVKQYDLGSADDALKLFLNEYCLYFDYGRNKCRQLMEVLDLLHLEQTMDKWCYAPIHRTESVF